MNPQNKENDWTNHEKINIFKSMKFTWVWQPVESFTKVFASAALVVIQWKKDGMMLQKPMASISWLGRTV